MTPEELVKLYQKVADGGTLEYYNGDSWASGITRHSAISGPSLGSDAAHYRVVEKPRELWVNEYYNNVKSYNSEAEALSCAEDEYSRIAVLYREVVE